MTKLIFSLIFLVMANVAWAQKAKPIELTSKRTYNQDVFDLGNGKQNYKIHVAQINYKDTDGSFKKIDTTLSFDNTKKAWVHSKASYQPVIPEYADDVFEFYNNYEGANHTLKAIPVASHVKGEYFKGDDGNGVLYKDAFGKGIDLKVYAYWAGLKKVIIINEKPADTKTALTFDFELILPTREETKDLTTKTVSAPIIDAKTATTWSKSKALDFTAKTLKIGFDDKCSYFRDARVWDSGELNQSVDISLYIKDGKTYIRKTITPEILDKAVYPLMTDHPTSYYAGAGDGSVQKTDNASWDTTHDATSGSSASPTSATSRVEVGLSSLSNYIIYRSFFPVDTSGIDDGASISSATLYLYRGSILTESDNDGDDWFNVIQTSQADETTLGTEDFDQCGSINNPTEGSTRKDYSDISSPAYNGWVLNATGITWISKTGYTKLGVREGHDCIDSAYAGAVNSYNWISFATSEDTSGTKDPYLDVTVEAGGGGTTQFPIESIGAYIGVKIGR